MTGPEAVGFERCMGVGGIAVFPADTVYGLACDPHSPIAVQRLYALKRRPLDKPSAVMFFALELALAALPELGPRTREALQRLLPGPVTVLLPNPGRRYPLACGADPQTLGLRVPVIAALHGVRWPVLQSSANRAGQAEARRLQDVAEPIRSRADLLVDGGELPGLASTVIDLRGYEASGEWRIVRPGAAAGWDVATALEGQSPLELDSYLAMIREDIPLYDRFQDELARATGTGARRVLELGTGTGETAARLLARHPDAALVGIDESDSMLAAARRRLGSERAELRVSRLEQALPAGPFDLVASALCVHHLEGAVKRDLFERVRAALAPGGRFVLGDVVIPPRPADAVIPLTPGYDHPSPLSEQLRWLAEAGFRTRVAWQHADLAVVVGESPSG